MDWKTKYGSYALITGASGGLGAEFAKQLAQKGMNLILVARRKDKLQTVADSLAKNYKVQVQIIEADLTTAGTPERIQKEIQQKGWDVGLLVNNAGFGTYGYFDELPLDTEINMVDLNIRVPLALTGLFLPKMVKQKKGGIIFLGSVGSYQPTPFFANYSATKAWNLLFAEALYGEVKHKGVDVICLTPGYTKTEFQAVAGNKEQKPLAGWSEPSDVVARCLKYLGKKPSTIPGFMNWFLAWSIRFTPRKMAISTAYQLLKPKG
ncbi:NADH(P)-binding protein [Leptospira ryugenii]|uniref:NADH(P)-binding protein n=1 Tax=Leptospira ryugenii TaxID=1917863 RepID=A0A2P2E0P3_9LEPT|nr:SDR family oxidoreductase [Leptospira ryugenii]GBF50451.1 NADH(P)-binding protein [Leptospira ryugenii]